MCVYVCVRIAILSPAITFALESEGKHRRATLLNEREVKMGAKEDGGPPALELLDESCPAFREKAKSRDRLEEATTGGGGGEGE